MNASLFEWDEQWLQLFTNVLFKHMQICFRLTVLPMEILSGLIANAKLKAIPFKRAISMNAPSLTFSH